MELARFMIKLQRQRAPVLHELWERITREPNRLHDVRAARQMLVELRGLGGCAAGTVDFGQDLAGLRGGQLVVFQLGAGKVGC